MPNAEKDAVLNDMLGALGKAVDAARVERQSAENRRVQGPDMRLPGEAFCADCPDHEACATAYPCDLVRRVATRPIPPEEKP